MARYKTDFSKVETFDLKPEGEYEGVIKELKFRPPRQGKQYPQISVTCVVTGGDFDKQKAWQNLSFSPKALYRMVEFFQLFGIHKDDLKAISDIDDEDPDQVDDEGNILIEPVVNVLDEPVLFTISHSTFQGKTNEQATVTEWLGEGDLGGGPVEDDDEDEGSEADDESDEDDEDDEEEEAPRPVRRAAPARRETTPARKTTAEPRKRSFR